VAIRRSGLNIALREHKKGLPILLVTAAGQMIQHGSVLTL